MTLTDDELIDLVDEVTRTLGQIFLNHRGLAESLLDVQQTDRSREKIDSLKKRMEDEKEKLTQVRRHQQRTKELERIRKSHETQTEGKMVSIRDQRGQVVGWIQTMGKDTSHLLDRKGQLVARYINGQTYDHRGSLVGVGDQKMRLLGRTSK